jgi:hypothetical protein
MMMSRICVGGEWWYVIGYFGSYKYAGKTGPTPITRETKLALYLLLDKLPQNSISKVVLGAPEDWQQRIDLWSSLQNHGQRLEEWDTFIVDSTSWESYVKKGTVSVVEWIDTKRNATVLFTKNTDYRLHHTPSFWENVLIFQRSSFMPRNSYNF